MNDVLGTSVTGAGRGGPAAGLVRLWAGWRGAYIDELTATDRGTASGAAPADGCPFCRILASGQPDDATLIVWRGATVFCILNAYPYTAGHVLVMPYRHVAGLDELTDHEAAEIWAMTRHAVGAVQRAYAPEGINVGANLGGAAGAGIPGHLHVHALPRWFGDTNFMTTIGEARVVPEALAASLERLRRVWEETKSSRRET